MGSRSGIAQVLPVFDTPNWLIRLLVVLIILGCPSPWQWPGVRATPEGISALEEADAMPAEAAHTKRTWIYVAIGRRAFVDRIISCRRSLR